MPDEPLFSVVIPAFNAARTLNESVASVLAQTCRDFEVIIVDDGSSDATYGVARAIDDPRVTARTQANGGAAAARNTGIEAARGKYVALLDADDVWVPYKLERQLAVFNAHPDVHAVQSGAWFVDGELQILYERRCRPSTDALLETLRFENLPATMSTLVVERSFFSSTGLLDTRLEILEEWDIMIKVARHCNLLSIEEPLTLYRVHPGNRSRNVDIHIAPGDLVLRGLFDDPTLPEHIRRRRGEIYGRFYAMLSGGSLRAHQWADCVRWGGRALRSDPATIRQIAGLPVRRAVRLWSKYRHRSTTAPAPVAG